MRAEDRSILLLVDTGTAHPDVVCSNVKLILLPPNMTSKLQPCDAEIIQKVKLHYRRILVRHALSHMDEATFASNLAKKVNVLDAIMWLKSEWDSAQPETIQTCFANL